LLARSMPHTPLRAPLHGGAVLRHPAYAMFTAMQKKISFRCH